MPERPQAIAFDFNGTLSDDEPILYAVYQELFTELGRPIDHEQYLSELAGYSDEEMFTRWLGRSDPALVEERVARYRARVADGSTVDEETRAAVRLAAARVPTALVSLALRSEIDPVLDATGLRPSLHVIVSLEDVERAKPDPEAYLRAAELLGVPPAAMVVVEDTPAGVAAARAAGARVVGLTRTVGQERLGAPDELAERVDTALVERLLCS